ncbi:MAG: AMP-binding protein [Paracoccaceae bacterium]
MSAYFAAIAAGAVAVPMPISAMPEVLARLIKDCEPTATFTDADGREALGSAPAGILFSLDEPTGSWRAPETGQPLETAQLMPDEALFNIIYSSGTTGTPKGIVHEHGMRNAQSARSLFGIGPDSMMLLSTPVYSNTTLMPLLSRSCMVDMFTLCVNLKPVNGLRSPRGNGRHTRCWSRSSTVVSLCIRILRHAI